MPKHAGTVPAIVRLEKWLTGGPDFMLHADVRLVLDALREADEIRFELDKLEQKHAQLRDDVDDLATKLTQFGVD